MSLEEKRDFQANEYIAENQEKDSQSFGFHKIDPKIHPRSTLSTSDSAYNSMVCSPFSPVVLVKDNKNTSPNLQKNVQREQGSTSPFSENDEIFNMSLEQIPSSNMASATFRPISMGTERPRYGLGTQRMEVQTRESNRKCCLTSKRSISTQTKFSINSASMYRPNSAPLQEDVEEELEEINIGRMVSTSSRIHRNSTCHCIRSHMPDLIQPTFQYNNQLIASQLSLIADQIDESINSQASTTIHARRRRFSTPTLADLAPGGSVFDLIISIYNAFDNSLPIRRESTSPDTDRQ